MELPRIMHPAVLATIAGLAAALSYATTPLAAKLARRVGAVDRPGHRRVHSAETPRLGGLAVVFSGWAVLTLLALGPTQYQLVLPGRIMVGLALGLLPIFLVSLRDDIRHVPARWKLLFHLIGAAIAVACGVRLSPVIYLFGSAVTIGWLAIPLSILWLTACTNAFNLIDGLDGLSAGLGLISAAGMIGVYAIGYEPGMLILSLVVAAALVGFLPYNIHPARVFLGDTGATALGFSLGAIAVSGVSKVSSGFAVLLPLFMLALPLTDTVVAMLRRGLGSLDTGAGVKFFQADRNHIHHRLLALGLTHAGTVFVLWAAATALALVALASIVLTSQQTAALLFGLLFSGILGFSRLGYEEFAVVKRGLALPFYDTPVLKASLFVVFVDLGITTAAAYAAVGLKFDDWGLVTHRRQFMLLGTLLSPVVAVVQWKLHLYRGSWKLAGLTDFVRLAQAQVIAGAIGYVIGAVAFEGLFGFSLMATFTLVSTVASAGARISFRLFQESSWRQNPRGETALIYGAGLGGVVALREFLSNAAIPLNPLGFIDDDATKRGKWVQGVRVLGDLSDLEAALVTTGARKLVLSTRKIQPSRISEARAICDRLGVGLLRFSVQLEPVADTSDQPPEIEDEPRSGPEPPAP